SLWLISVPTGTRSYSRLLHFRACGSVVSSTGSGTLIWSMYTSESRFATVASTRPKVVFERTYRARVDELWELWTPKEGFESWWGPEGFRDHARSDARRGIHPDVDHGLHEPAY